MKMWRPQQLFVGERAQTKAKAVAMNGTTREGTNRTTRVSNGDGNQRDGDHSERQRERRSEDKNQDKGEFDLTGIKTVASAAAMPVQTVEISSITSL
jgi:hypothetical protein